MKKTLLSLSIALAAAFGVAATAQAQDTNGAGGFIGAQVGNAHWNAQGDTANRFAYGVNGGYRWSLDQNQSLGADVGYENFGKISNGNAYGDSSVKAYAWTLGGNYRYTFDNNVYLQGRAGYMRWTADANANVYGLSHYSDSTSGNGWYAGAAVGYDITKNLGVNVGYNFHRANADNGHVNFGVASVGAEYRF